MSKNIFENAYFGKAYKTRDGRKAIYFCQPSKEVAHRLFIEGTLTYTTYNNYGRVWITEGPDDIISEWEEETSKNDDLVALPLIRSHNEGYRKAVEKACKWIIEHNGDDHIIESFKEAMYE